MNPLKVWRIAKREYLVNFRRRTFLLTAFGMPILLGVIMFVVISLATRAIDDISGYKSVGIVDEATVLTESGNTPVVELTRPFRLFLSRDDAAAALQNGQIDGYYVIPANYVNSGAVESYYRQTLAFNEGLDDALDELLKKALAIRLGDERLAARLEDPLAELSAYRLGNEQRLDPSAVIGVIFVPIIVGTIVFILIMSTSQYLMQGLVEEKENRMMEVFITSARPSEMLWGKLLGLGALGLTLVLIWVGMGLAFAAIQGSLNVGQLLAQYQITPAYLLLILAYSVLSYLLFGAIMCGIGASVSAEQESRQLASVLSIVGVVPLMLSFVFFVDPNGPLAVFLSLFPFTATTSMLFRLALASVPPIQVILSIVFMFLTVLVVMWLAARIFRLGMLNYGKRLSVRDIWRGLREGRRQIITSAAQERVS